jgi:hypothetical protein
MILFWKTIIMKDFHVHKPIRRPQKKMGANSGPSIWMFRRLHVNVVVQGIVDEADGTSRIFPTRRPLKAEVRRARSESIVNLSTSFERELVVWKVRPGRPSQDTPRFGVSAAANMGISSTNKHEGREEFTVLFRSI